MKQILDGGSVTHSALDEVPPTRVRPRISDIRSLRGLRTKRERSRKGISQEDDKCVQREAENGGGEQRRPCARRLRSRSPSRLSEENLLWRLEDDQPARTTLNIYKYILDLTQVLWLWCSWCACSSAAAQGKWSQEQQQSRQCGIIKEWWRAKTPVWQRAHSRRCWHRRAVPRLAASR